MTGASVVSTCVAAQGASSAVQISTIGKRRGLKGPLGVGTGAIGGRKKKWGLPPCPPSKRAAAIVGACGDVSVDCSRHPTMQASVTQTTRVRCTDTLLGRSNEGHRLLLYGSSRKKPTKRIARSVGFAIRSPRGIGEPHDIAPRGSQHLSCVPICACDARPQGRGPHHKSALRGGGGDAARPLLYSARARTRGTAD